MRIWHVYVTGGMQRVDGILTASVLLAERQAQRGHDVTAWLVNDDPDGLADAVAVDTVDLRVDRSVTSAVSAMSRRLRDDPPDVAHLHACFRPPHALLAAGPLRRAGVPYVVSPHSALAAPNLSRYRVRKAVYRTVVERRYLRAAAALSCLTPVECADARRFANDAIGAARAIANPAPDNYLTATPWSPPQRGRPRLVTLARHDVVHKGLDTLAEIARRLPDVDVVVHGCKDANQPRATVALRRSAPSNFRLSPPVYGADKLDALRGATMFVQPSRWEGLSAALVEAMAIGVPCAVSQYVARTLPFASQGLGLVLDADPALAAAQLSAALAGADMLRRWSGAARRYAVAHFDATEVADQTVALYREALVSDRVRV